MENFVPTSSLSARQLSAALVPPDEIFASNLVTIPRKEFIHLRWESNCWKVQHQRAFEREALLKEKLKVIPAS
jgi:hypothetical protein